MAKLPDQNDWFNGGRISPAEPYPEIQITYAKETTTVSNNELWANLKTVNPHIEEGFESFGDFEQNLRDAAALVRGEDALKKLANAFHPSYAVYVEDGLADIFDEAEPDDFADQNDGDEDYETEEGNERD